MKIAVVHNLPPGGMKRALYEQVKRLSKKHTLDLYTLTCTDESFLPLKKFVRRHVTEKYDPPEHFPGSVFSIYTRLPVAYKDLAKCINDEGYDVVFVNPCRFTQSPYILRYLKTPSLYQCPEPKREFYENIPRISNKAKYYLTLPFRMPLKEIDKTCAKCANKIIVHSNYSKESIDRIYGVNSSVLRLGVDSDFFKVENGQKENMVMTVGDFSLLKAQDFLIRSISLISRDLRPKLMLVGHSGVEKKYFIDLAEKLNVEMEVFHGISDEELLDYYHRATAFVYSSLREPFGLVLLEALACGLAVVSVDDGAVSEIITNDELGVLTKRDENEFSKALLSFLSAGKEHDKKMERHKFVKKFWSWEKSVKKLEEYFQETTQIIS